jgi:hypothetical protein
MHQNFHGPTYKTREIIMEHYIITAIIAMAAVKAKARSENSLSVPKPPGEQSNGKQKKSDKKADDKQKPRSSFGPASVARTRASGSESRANLAGKTAFG